MLRICNRFETEGRLNQMKEKTTKNSFVFILLWAAIFLLISILLPTMLSSPVQLKFLATLSDADSPSDANFGQPFLPGNIREEYSSVLSSRYSAVFVPSRLERGAPKFSGVQFMYAPVLLTGIPVELHPDKPSVDAGLDGEITYSLAGFGSVFLFYFLLVAVLILLKIFTRQSGAFIKFAVALTIVWFIWGFILMLFGYLITAPINEFANSLLTEQQGSANFQISNLAGLGAGIRVCFTAVLVWALIALYELAKKQHEPVREI